VTAADVSASIGEAEPNCALNSDGSHCTGSFDRFFNSMSSRRAPAPEDTATWSNVITIGSFASDCVTGVGLESDVLEDSSVVEVCELELPLPPQPATSTIAHTENAVAMSRLFMWSVLLEGAIKPCGFSWA
jgi:hypothetical protein